MARQWAGSLATGDPVVDCPVTGDPDGRGGLPGGGLQGAGNVPDLRALRSARVSLGGFGARAGGTGVQAGGAHAGGAADAPPAVAERGGIEDADRAGFTAFGLGKPALDGPVLDGRH